MNSGPVSAGDTGRPFPGLRPFGYDDRNFYFGRTAQIYSLYRMLDRSRFVAVVGSSGSGKSSLVFAGLRPLLERDSAGAGGRQWIWRQMSPKTAPVDGLIDLVCRLARDHQPDSENDPAFLASQRDRIAYLIRLSSRGLVDALAEIEGLKDKVLVLLVDQFEELFRYAQTSSLSSRSRDSFQREEAVLFVQLLLEASRAPGSDTRIVLTMRSDFIGDCAAFRGLPEAVSETQFLVPSLARDQLEEVIRKPIQKCGATIDSGLVERLLNDAIDESDQLPVLQHCLLRLWQAAGEPAIGAGSTEVSASAEPPARNITVAHYNAIGRIAGALSQHADEILRGLPGLEPVAERVFRALSEVDKEGRATRREVAFRRLIEETGDREADLRTVLDRFRADDCSFLRPTSSDRSRLEDDTPIDVGHEALLRRWEKVRGDAEATGEANDKRPIGWLREEAKDGRRYQALLSMADGAATSEEGLPLPQVERTWEWWTRIPRTEAWAERYGGHYAKVRQLLNDGRIAFRTDQNRRWRIRWASRGAVIAGCVLLLIIGWENFQLVKERQATRIALQVMQSLVKTVVEGVGSGEVSTGAATALMTTASAGIATLAGIEQTSATLSTEIYMALANSDVAATLGNNDNAYQEAMVARNLANKLVALDSGNSASQELVYQSLFRIADILSAPGPKQDLRQSLVMYEQAQAIARQLVANGPGDGALLYDLAFINNKVGETLQDKGDLAGAIKQFEAALKIAREIAAMPSAIVQWQAYLPSTLTKLANALATNRDPEAAFADYSEAISLQEELHARFPGNDIVSANLALSHRQRADLLTAQNKFDVAVADYGAALEIAKQLVDKDSGNSIWLTYLASIYEHYGNALKESGDVSGALALYQNELVVRQRLVRKDPANSNWQKDLQTIEVKVAVLVLQTQGARAQPTKNPSSQKSMVEAKP